MSETIQTIAAVLVAVAYLQFAVGTYVVMGKWAEELRDAGRDPYPFGSKFHRAYQSLFWPAVLIAFIGAK